MQTSILTAGTFDHFHIGHQHYLWTAQNNCESLTIIVARDTTVEKIKKRKPRNTEEERLRRLELEGFSCANIELGHPEGDFWATIKRVNPDVIYLGYDQGFDEKTCREKFPHIKIERAPGYFPEFFKSSRF